jgi:hypothetical protein
METLFSFYEEVLISKDFYNTLKHLINKYPEEFNNKLLLENNSINHFIELPSNEIIVKNDDLRIDMPILLGNSYAKERIMVIGLEPRHTDNFYNIISRNNNVFATPFGIDKWYSKSKQNIYGSAFKKYLIENRLFLFTDFVKEYKIIKHDNKKINDLNARNNFQYLFDSKYKKILEQEIQIFKPNLIIGLGKGDISRKVDKSFLNKHNIAVICHPSNGNFKKMQLEIETLLNQVII